MKRPTKNTITLPTEFMNVIPLIAEERTRQRLLVFNRKIPWDCSHLGVPDEKKLAVLLEEVGGVAKAIVECPNLDQANHIELNDYRKHLLSELIQVAAVAVAWAELLSARIKGANLP